jgi:hypothetical protein
MKTRAPWTLPLPAIALLIAGCTSQPIPEQATSEVDGMRVLTVTQALAARDAGAAGEIAIGGWFSAAPVHSCPAPFGPDGQFREPNPLELYCREGDWAIAERPEAIVEVTTTTVGDSTSTEVRGRTMAGAWLQPVLTGDADALATGPEPWRPVPVVLIGHFGDARAATCLPELRKVCSDRFVVDSVRRP